MDYQDAKNFTGSDAVSGKIQLELLQREGLKPYSRVLDVGCGALHAGFEIIQYVDVAHYVGIEPNTWLVDVAFSERPGVRAVATAKGAEFMNVSDFDSLYVSYFDFALAHSILSHCADWQLEQFLQNVGAALVPGGKIVASIRLAQGNTFGSTGTPDGEGTHEKAWEYPGVSWFKLSEVVETARRLGFQTEHKPEYGAYYASIRPYEHHDWLIFTKAQ